MRRTHARRYENLLNRFWLTFGVLLHLRTGQWWIWLAAAERLVTRCFESAGSPVHGLPLGAVLKGSELCLLLRSGSIAARAAESDRSGQER